MLADNFSIVTTTLIVMVTAVCFYGPKRTIYRVATMLQDGVTRAVFGKEKVTSIHNFYDLIDRNMAGEEVSMSSFKGKVLLLVNVASK